MFIINLVNPNIKSSYIQYIKVNCANTMNLCSPFEIPGNAEFAIKGALDTSRLPQNSHTIISPIILKREIEQQNGAHESQKISMDQLCEVFLKTIGTRRPCQFNAKQLIDNSGIQQRRVYDLMNILQGCGFVRRISKGIYNWLGFQEAGKKKRAKQGMKKKATSLYNLAARVKNLLYLLKEEITFKNICQKMLEQNNDKKQNPDSIRRRVYECCKVLHVLGFIGKENGKFKWIQSHQRDRNVFVTKQERKERLKRDPPTSYKSQQKSKSKGKQYQQRIFHQLLNEIENEKDFNEMLARFRLAFNKKYESQVNERRLFKDA